MHLDELKDHVLHSAPVTMSDFKGRRLEGLDLSNAQFMRCDFTDATLVNCDLSMATFGECRMEGARLDGNTGEDFTFATCDTGRVWMRSTSVVERHLHALRSLHFEFHRDADAKVRFPGLQSQPGILS